MKAINWPDSKNYYKFVQLYVGEEPVITFGPIRSYHSRILKKTLEDFGIEFKFSVSEGEVIPDAEGAGYRAAGMGDIWVEPDDRKMEFCNNSAHYGLSTDVDHMKRLQELYPDWDIGLMKMNY